MIRKRKSGSVDKILPLIMTLVVISILLVIFVNWSGDFNKKDRIDLVCRQYLLKMESKGYLNQSDKNNLINSLNEIGVNDVDLTGTTISEVQYGDKIVLLVKGRLKTHTYTLDSMLGLNEEDTYIDIYNKLESTAKN